MRVALLVVLLISGCAAAPPDEGRSDSRAAGHLEHAEHVSLLDLVADPAAYAGRRVQVLGYLGLEFEGQHLEPARFGRYLPRELTVWVQMRCIEGLNESVEAEAKSFGLVVVEGIASTDGSRGAICSICEAVILHVVPRGRVKRLPSPASDPAYQKIQLLREDWGDDSDGDDERRLREEAKAWLVENAGRDFAESWQWQAWWGRERLPGLARETYQQLEDFYFPKAQQE